MRDCPRTAVVLAGGLGTRLRPAVADRPKPMAEIAGRPLLEHLICYWRSQGIERFLLSVGYLHDFIRSHFKNSYAGCEIDYAIEDRPLGTGGGLLMCQKKFALNEPFLLLNGDTFFPVESSALHLLATRHNADWALSLFTSRDTLRYHAAEIDDSGRLRFRGLGESPTPNASANLANGGVYWVNPRALRPFGDIQEKTSLESEIIPRCQEIGQVFCGHRSDATFIDIGIPEDYSRSQTMPCFRYQQE